jgi:hypothetical protein
VRARLFALTLLVTVVLKAPTAHADTPTSWLALGTGASVQRDNLDHVESLALAASAEIGIGTPSTSPLVVGGVFRAMTHFTLGTDLSLSGRVATSGFARGLWGLALDLGVTAKWWAQQEYGHFPITLVGIVGFPGGLHIEAGAQFLDVTGDSPTAKGGFVIFAVDFFAFATASSHVQKGFWSDPPPQMQVIEHDIQQPIPAPPP